MNLNIYKINFKRHLCLIISAALFLSLIGCSSLANPFRRTTDFNLSLVFFDTLIKITVYDDSKENADNLLNDCKDLCSYYEELFSASNPNSDISKLNNSNGNAIKVSNDTVTLLEKSLYYSDLSNGYFDPTIYSITQLWDFHDINNDPPSAELINNNLTHVDYKNIIIDNKNQTITFLDPQTQIDVGGIAKGYIADKLCEYLQKANVSGAILNIGGDISTLGCKPDGSPFVIGVYNPVEQSTSFGVKIAGESIATSGTYERKIEYDGTTYHHILDPKTGYSANTDLVSATIITKMAIDADSLCTIAILLGSDKTLSLINSLDDTECILIKTDGTIITSDKAKYLLSS